MKTRFALAISFGTVAEKLTGPKLIEGYMKRIDYTSKTPWPPAAAKYRTKLWPAMGYKEPPAGFGLNTYSCIHIIARAMEKAGTTTDVMKIRQAAPSVVPLPEEFNTANISTFLENGDGVMKGEMGFFRNGKLVPHDAKK
jgi:ABC-type branched-subunit amino acid transport system substrate-binding protein